MRKNLTSKEIANGKVKAVAILNGFLFFTLYFLQTHAKSTYRN